jgi:hypothetical protein
MNTRQQQAETQQQDAPGSRAEWKRPEVRRMTAGQAETAFTSGSDGATQAS